MTEQIHTSLPWGLLTLTEHRQECLVRGADDGIVADCYCKWRSAATNEANARLIVRAVNNHDTLLAALKEIVSLRRVLLR